METTTMYRDEKSGELHGLSRVRSLTTDDGHEFVRIDQIEEEIASILNMVEKMYKTLDLPLSIDLSFRDSSEKYFGDKEIWARAEGIIKEVAENHKLDFKVVEGEAAFYGPKIDIHVRDSLGRKWQCATVQLDFIQPERFELEYTDSDGLKKRPVMIHKAILGSIERFLGVYIEHTAGKFPMWLAPEQLRVVTLNQSDELVNYAKNFVANATQRGLRVKLDNDNESVGKKIRSAEVQKVPYIVVIGMKEVENSILVPRIRTGLQNSDTQVSVSSEEFINKLVSEYESRTNKSTL
jgi:threonyl-tRNA synthetase